VEKKLCVRPQFVTKVGVSQDLANAIQRCFFLGNRARRCMKLDSSARESSISKPRRVLLVVENLPVPYDRRVWQEALALKAANYEVSVISPATAKYPSLAEQIEGIHVYRYPMLIEGRGYIGLITEYIWSFICIFFATLFVSVRRGFKAIVMANPPDIYFPIMWMWRLLGKSTVFDHHDLTPELFATKFNLDRSVVLSFFYFAERRMLRAVHKVISTNESYKAIAMRRGGRTAEDVVVVRNSPDPQRFTVLSPDSGLRKSAKYLVAFLGEIGQQDGVDVLIRAISAINAQLGPQAVHYVLMGAGPHYDNIVAYAQRSGVAEQITFTGRADNDTICRVLSSADLAVDPCPYSPHANVSTATKIMEYMFFSLPIVAFDLLETRRSAEGSIWYARRGDEAHFSELIVELLRHETRRRALGRAGRIRLNTALSWGVSSRNLVALMDGLIGGSPVEVPDPLTLDKVGFGEDED
jgi:glycosyltransferase involved in cell wall biosynthesis